MVLVLHWVTAVDSGPPKLQSRFNPDNSRSVFHYRGNPVLNTTSNTVTYTNGYDNHNGILSVDDTVSRPSPMHCVNGLGNGNLPYINPSDRVSTSATGGDNEHQIVTATNINVRTMTHLGDCQNENDRCSCCGDGIEQHNQRADERIASMDEIV